MTKAVMTEQLWCLKLKHGAGQCASVAAHLLSLEVSLVWLSEVA